MAHPTTADDNGKATGGDWRAMLGPYAAVEGCECQAIAFAILARCGGDRAAERDRLSPRIAER